MPVSIGALAVLLVAACSSACVFSGRNPDDDAPTGYGITFYEPFDNSRDWGPGYLAGPPRGTMRYEHDQGRGSEEHSLVHTDTNGTAPSIPDATRSADNSDKSEKSDRSDRSDRSDKSEKSGNSAPDSAAPGSSESNTGESHTGQANTGESNPGKP